MSLTLYNTEDEFLSFGVEDLERGEKSEDDLFLLSLNGKDFMASRSDLRNITKEFPGSVTHKYRCVNISKKAYFKIIGRHLKPMDTDCLESAYR